LAIYIVLINQEAFPNYEKASWFQNEIAI